MRNARLVLCLLLVVTLGTLAAADEPPMTLLNPADFASVDAARKALRPIERPTPPVELVTTAGRRVINLPCNFRTNDEWRVAWDLSGKWDLASCREIVLEVSTERGERMTLYLHSGDGWYRGGFYAPAGLHTITLSRKDFETEDRPGGFDAIDILRISVRRNEAVDRMVGLSGIRAVLARPHVALYRNDAGLQREQGIPYFTRLAADSLDRLEVDYELMGDAEVASGRLKDKQVAILPLNPVLPEAAAREVEKFVAAGGKLLVCFSLPAPLDRLLGVRSAGHVEGGKDGPLASIVFEDRKDRPRISAVQDSWIARTIVPLEGTRTVGWWVDAAGTVSKTAAVTRNPNGYFVAHVLTQHAPLTKDPLILEMLGELYPGLYRDLYDRRRQLLGKVGGFAGVGELAAAARKNAASEPARLTRVNEMLTEADRAERQAGTLLKDGDARRAYEVVARARDAFTRAYASSIPPREGEFRAVWCHQPTGVRGKTWDDAIGTLAASGFNAIIPNMSWGFGAAYPSKVLPMVAEADGKDQLALCLAAAKKHGVQVHVWRVNWCLHWSTPKDLRDRLAREGRLQQDPAGKTLDWLCPSNDLNRTLERDAMLEVVRNYDVSGIHFDYIRYPGETGCYCPRCRTRFETTLGVKVANWPADVRTGALRQKYLQFRRDNITALVHAVSEEARRINPKVKVSAAVFWHYTSARDDVAQDWKLWIEKGWLDFVCPMQYTRSAEEFDDMTRQTVGWVGGRIPLVPGIGATLGLSSDGTLRQLLIARSHNTAGFVLFNYDTTLADEHLPLLRLGPTSDTPPLKHAPTPAGP